MVVGLLEDLGQCHHQHLFSDSSDLQRGGDKQLEPCVPTLPTPEKETLLTDRMMDRHTEGYTDGQNYVQTKFSEVAY